MNDRFDHILHDFLNTLKGFDIAHRMSVQKANEGIHICNSTLYGLRKILEKHAFTSELDEIYFFKQIKMEPLSYLVYFSEVRSLELRMPRIGLKDKLVFLKKKTRRINKFFNHHRDFVFYMDQGFTYQDSQYFIRKHHLVSEYNLPEASYMDPNFFTSHDMLWSRVKGMNYLIRYIKNINRALEKQRQMPGRSNGAPRGLNWTAPKTALVELIYALHCNQVINHGKEDISKIANGFEELFDIELDNIYKTYCEIKARKGKRTRFLEELVLFLNRKMDADDGLH